MNDNGEAMDGDGSLNPSPRKKLRKQQFNTQPWMSDELAKNTGKHIYVIEESGEGGSKKSASMNHQRERGRT